MNIQKIDFESFSKFDTTPEELEKEDRIFLPHTGYSFKYEKITKRDKFAELFLQHHRNQNKNDSNDLSIMHE